MFHLFKYLKPYKYYALFSPLLMMGEGLADLCLPYLMSFIVNYGIIGEDIAENRVAAGMMRLFFGAGPYAGLQIILTFGVLMLLVVLIGGFFGTFCAYTAAKAAQGAARRPSSARSSSAQVSAAPPPGPLPGTKRRADEKACAKRPHFPQTMYSAQSGLPFPCEKTGNPPLTCFEYRP